MQALRARASKSEAVATQLLGRWHPDSLSVFAWDAVLSDSAQVTLARSQASIERTLDAERAGTLTIETVWAEDGTYTHRLLDAEGAERYTKNGTWRVDACGTIACTRADGGLCPHDGYRVLRLDLDALGGPRLVLGHEWTEGDAAGLGERIYLRRQP
ncbi:MAG: hypothetical protein AAGG50_03535 [Bacteroidota bacterium]